MCRNQMISILLGILAGTPVLAQEGGEETPNPCTVEPIFHCVQSMDDGIIIGHFGYRGTCPEDDKKVNEIYIEIGDDNYFAPEPIDRGQPKIFMRGMHVDEFEVEFSAKELKGVKELGWTVLNVVTKVDFSKMKDASLDCGSFP